MNYENLHELIHRYEANLDTTMGPVHREQFKWEAMKLFRDVWFSEDAGQLPFADMFNQARKGCGWMIDNSRISPTSGVVKMAQAEPDTVEHLFKEVLFAEDNGDLSLRQSHMDDFVDQIETLRIKLFPRHWKYKHDRHAASCYRSFFAPDQDYVYRFSDADLMARYIGFEKSLGSGQYFSLPAYYEMCDITTITSIRTAWDTDEAGQGKPGWILSFCDTQPKDTSPTGWTNFGDTYFVYGE